MAPSAAPRSTSNDAGTIDRLRAFLDGSPSPFHACATAAALLDRAGFERLDESAPWEAAGTGRRYVIRDGSILAWAEAPDTPAAAPFRLVGAHTDSPNLRVKPQPDRSAFGFGQVGIEVYGGVLLNSWLDRDLGLSGRVALADGTLPLVRIDEPLLRVPQLAIHLDRDVNTSGLRLNPQVHLHPVWTSGPQASAASVAAVVAESIGVQAGDIVAWDLMVHDLNPAAVVGLDRSMLASARIDNLASAWAAVEALVTAADAPAVGPSGPITPVVVLFDHEEIGSDSNRGAGSPLLATALERIVAARLDAPTASPRDDLHRALAASACLSADMAHATHPNYPDRHDPDHLIAFGAGPVVKTNVNQRYASDARSTAAFLAACDQAGVAHQHYSHRNDLPCGSTIGPITAAGLGIATVDVGAAMLGMHSARELMAVADAAPYRDAMAAFLAPASAIGAAATS